MGLLHSFTISVLSVAFLCYFSEALTCEGPLKKYTSLVTGMVVSLCIVCAVLQVKEVKLQSLALPEIEYEAPSRQAQDAVVEKQFASDLETAVEHAVFTKFKCEVKAYASVRIDNGVITLNSLGIENRAIERGALCDFIETQFGITPQF